MVTVKFQTYSNFEAGNNIWQESKVDDPYAMAKGLCKILGEVRRGLPRSVVFDDSTQTVTIVIKDTRTKLRRRRPHRRTPSSEQNWRSFGSSYLLKVTSDDNNYVS